MDSFEGMVTIALHRTDRGQRRLAAVGGEVKRRSRTGLTSVTGACALILFLGPGCLDLRLTQGLRCSTNHNCPSPYYCSTPTADGVCVLGRPDGGAGDLPGETGGTGGQGTPAGGTGGSSTGGVQVTGTGGIGGAAEAATGGVTGTGRAGPGTGGASPGTGGAGPNTGGMTAVCQATATQCVGGSSGGSPMTSSSGGVPYTASSTGGTTSGSSTGGSTTAASSGGVTAGRGGTNAPSSGGAGGGGAPMGNAGAGGPSLCPVAGTTLCDGFEGAAPGTPGSDFMIDVAAGDTITVDTTKAYRGTKSMKFSGTSRAYITETKTFMGTTKAVVNNFWGRYFIFGNLTGAAPTSHAVYGTLSGTGTPGDGEFP